MQAASEKPFLRLTLSGVLAVRALHAWIAAVPALVLGPPSMSLWLRGSPFGVPFVPSVFLAFVVGGASFFAAIAVLARWSFARQASFAAGYVVLGWLMLQMALIGPASPLQPFALIATISSLLLTWLLPPTTPVDVRV